MAEMFTGKPLFPGKSNDDQLLCIFELLGTPTEETWPGVKSYSEWKPTPWYPPQDLNKIAGGLGPTGVGFLSLMLQYQPQLRMHASDALNHPYFSNYVQRMQQGQPLNGYQ